MRNPVQWINKVFVDSLCIVDSFCIVDPLEPFYGGQTEAFTTFKETNRNIIDYYDDTSLYPFVSKIGKIPLGHPRIITENFEGINSY